VAWSGGQRHGEHGEDRQRHRPEQIPPAGIGQPARRGRVAPVQPQDRDPGVLGQPGELAKQDGLADTAVEVGLAMTGEFSGTGPPRARSGDPTTITSIYMLSLCRVA
jgi:hypothetical protein